MPAPCSTPGAPTTTPPTALAARLDDPGHLCRSSTVRCAALHRRLRAADRRHHRPAGHHERSDSNCTWIRIGGNVRPNFATLGRLRALQPSVRSALASSTAELPDRPRQGGRRCWLRGAVNSATISAPPSIACLANSMAPSLVYCSRKMASSSNAPPFREEPSSSLDQFDELQPAIHQVRAQNSNGVVFVR